MKIKTLFCLTILLASMYGFVQTADLSDLIQPGAKLEKLAGNLEFTEGPSADSKGNVFFTDQPNDRIMEWSVSEQLSVFLQPCGRSNGLCFDTEGYLWACADEKNELWRIAPDKSISIIPSKYDNKILNGPNDLWIAGNGGIYFTDPFYKRTWWNHTDKPQDCQCVYYLQPDHKTIVRLIDDLVQPNGIMGSMDGKILYISDFKGNKTWSYTLNHDGSLSNKKLFCEMGSDGMTTDVRGNIYLTGNGVTVFDRYGKKIGNIEIPEKWTANVCFGGSEMKSLFITASKGLYRLRMKVKGAAS